MIRLMRAMTVTVRLIMMVIMVMMHSTAAQSLMHGPAVIHHEAA